MCFETHVPHRVIAVKEDRGSKSVQHVVGARKMSADFPPWEPSSLNAVSGREGCGGSFSGRRVLPGTVTCLPSSRLKPSCSCCYFLPPFYRRGRGGADSRSEANRLPRGDRGCQWSPRSRGPVPRLTEGLAVRSGHGRCLGWAAR